MPDSGAFRRPATRAQLVLAFAAVYVLWGSTYLAIRFGVETIPPFLMAGLRHFTAGLLLFGWLRLRGTPAPERRHWGPAAAIGGLMLLGGNGLVSWAEQRVPSGLAALIVACVPIWMTLLDGIQNRRRPHGIVLVGLAAGLAGLAFLVAPGKFAGGAHVDLLGAGALMLASLLWATGSLYARRAKLPASTLMATAMEMIAGGAILFGTSTLARRVAGLLDRRRLESVPLRALLPDRRGIAPRLHGLHLPARRDDAGAGLDVRLRQPGRRGVSGLGVRRRGRDGADRHRGARHRELGGGDHPVRRAEGAKDVALEAAPEPLRAGRAS